MKMKFIKGLCYHELVDDLTEEMRNDSKIDIISDSAIFLIMPRDHAKEKYSEFRIFPVSELAYTSYEEQIINNKIK